MVGQEMICGFGVRMQKWERDRSAYAEVECVMECVCGSRGGEVVVAKLNFFSFTGKRRTSGGCRTTGGRSSGAGRFQARDEHLGFEVEVAKLVKSERYCGWKWWR